jgi:colanic acid biosynthesis glycosyl transferase WcaI
MPAWQRILHDSSLTLSGLPRALLGGRPDVVLSITPPLQLAAGAMALNKLWRRPILNWIQDIVPDAALNVGMMREGPALRLARKMENYVYRNADRLGIISEGFRANLANKGVPPDKMLLMPNWADAAAPEEPVDGDHTRTELGLSRGDFLLLHAGSIAAKQALENVVRAMKELELRREIQLLILGDGSRRDAVEAEARRLGLERVHFMPPVSLQKHRELLRAADLLVLNQARDVVDALVPSKLLTYMPSGRPVIAAVNAASEAAHFVEASGGGVVVEPENPEAFAATVVRLQSQPEVRAEMGRRGNAYVRRNYGKAELLARFEATLRNLVHKA